MKKIYHYTLIFLEILLALFIVCYGIWCIKHRDSLKSRDVDTITPEEEIIIFRQKEYEVLLDSTARYIYVKYGEFLPDTYWKNPVYTNLYDDLECWDRDYLKY